MSLTLEKLTEDLEVLNQRKDQALQSLHQIVGAISIIEQMIYRLKNPDWEKKSEENLPIMDVLSVEPAEQVENIQ